MDITIYTSTGCGWCTRTKELLERAKITDYTEINWADLSEDEQEQFHVDYPNVNGFPVIFVDGELYAATKMLSAVEFRATNIESFDNLEKNSVDFYASVKSLYNQDRENKIKNTQRGSIEIIYKEDQDWEEIDSK